jgi:hypothetical protein
MKKAILILCGLAALTLTACSGCKCKENRRPHHRAMKFQTHFEKMKWKPEMREKMHERNKKHNKKG